jgi:hypothetical protein
MLTRWWLTVLVWVGTAVRVAAVTKVGAASRSMPDFVLEYIDTM